MALFLSSMALFLLVIASLRMVRGDFRTASAVVDGAMDPGQERDGWRIFKELCVCLVQFLCVLGVIIV
jgi:hypothetical protein